MLGRRGARSATSRAPLRRERHSTEHLPVPGRQRRGEVLLGPGCGHSGRSVIDASWLGSAPGSPLPLTVDVTAQIVAVPSRLTLAGDVARPVDGRRPGQVGGRVVPRGIARHLADLVRPVAELADAEAADRRRRAGRPTVLRRQALVEDLRAGWRPLVERLSASSDLEEKLVTRSSVGTLKRSRTSPVGVTRCSTIGAATPKLESTRSLLNT